MTETISYIPSRVKNCAEGGHVAGAIDIIDDGSGITLDELVGNKKYASADFSGMGRVVFKKNIVNGVNTLTKEMMSDANTIYVIQYDFTLGEDITVPANCVLEFEGGSVSGAYIITGNNTQINASDVPIFSDIIISGSWNCPRITSKWFSDVTNENRLKQVFNLTNTNVQNEIIIGSGNYSVSVSNENEVAIRIISNTNVKIAGTISMLPNALDTYYIFRVLGSENISIEGGLIVGDKATHTGDIGEHGMGIAIDNSKNIRISNIEIKDCWGDSLYIGHSTAGLSENIVVENFSFHGSRRQGISVINAKNILIENGKIYDINGTKPKSCIDFEPNEGTDIIENVVVRNVEFANNSNFVSYVKPAITNKIISGIKIINCTFTGIYNLSLSRLKSLEVIGCTFNGGYALEFTDLENVVVTANKFNAAEVYTPININHCKNVDFFNNNIDDIVESLTENYSKNTIFITSSEDIVLSGNTISTNRASIIRPDHFLKISHNTLINTLNDGYLFRHDALIADSYLEGNKINCLGRIEIPYNTTLINNEINAASILFKNSKISNCIITSKYVVLKESIISNSEMISTEAKFVGAFIVLCDSNIIDSCKIRHNVTGGDQVIYIGGKEWIEEQTYAGQNNIISNIEIKCNKNLANSVINGLFGNNGNVLKDIIADVSSITIQSEVYINDNVLSGKNKIIPPLPVAGNTASRDALDAFYLLPGFEFFVTDSTPAKPNYWNGTAWVDATGTPV